MSTDDRIKLLVAALARLQGMERTRVAYSLRHQPRGSARTAGGFAHRNDAPRRDPSRAVNVETLLAVGRAFRRRGAKNLADEQVTA